MRPGIHHAYLATWESEWWMNHECGKNVLLSPFPREPPSSSKPGRRTATRYPDESGTDEMTEFSLGHSRASQQAAFRHTAREKTHFYMGGTASLCPPSGEVNKLPEKKLRETVKNFGRMGRGITESAGLCTDVVDSPWVTS